MLHTQDNKMTITTIDGEDPALGDHHGPEGGVWLEVPVLPLQPEQHQLPTHVGNTRQTHPNNTTLFSVHGTVLPYFQLLLVFLSHIKLVL